MRLLLDCDGVLLDYANLTLKTLEQVSGCRFPYEHLMGPTIEKSLPTEFREIVRKAQQQKGWCESIQPTEGAVEAVRLLRDLSDVRFVTTPLSTNPYWLEERRQAIKRFFDAKDEEITFTYEKEYVRGDIIVDDMPPNVIQWKNQNLNKTAVLWSQPWNCNFLGDRKFIYMNDWDALINLVKGVSNEKW